jgi:hypothetical protein
MMREERPDSSLFIGLHKLAEQNGDGLVPELYALLTQNAPASDMTNVVTFPADRREASREAVANTPARILAFRR